MPYTETLLTRHMKGHINVKVPPYVLARHCAFAMKPPNLHPLTIQ